MNIEELEDIFKNHLLLPDTMVIRVVLATIVANKIKGDPLWLFVIAPPSSAKTEIISSLNGLPDIFPLSSLTSHTLASGMVSVDDKERSLIYKLTNKIVTLKDFTSILTMHRESRAEILSQLREIYDGSYKKHFGTGEKTDWTGKIGIIAGVTPIIDTYYSIFQLLGERFIQFRMELPEPVEVALKAIANSGKEKKIRYELKGAIAKFINEITMPHRVITVPLQIERRIAYLSAFCVKARSGSVREGRSRELIYTPPPEAPPRLAKQFIMLARGLAIVNGKKIIQEKDYNVVYKVGLDTVPKLRRDILSILNDEGTLSTNDLTSKLRYPYSTVDRALEELRSLDLVDCNETKQWNISSATKNYLAEIKPVSETSIG